MLVGKGENLLRIMITITLLTLASLVWANDGAMSGEGGSVCFIHGKHTSIRMVREWVNMDVYPDDYHVKVQFIFQNDGPATTVTMGFPERGGGDGVDGKRSGFLSFHTWVDGSEVKAERKLHSTEEEEDYLAFWVKTVHFAQHQQRIVRVEYVASQGYSEDAGFNDSNISYDFTGGNWKGEVEESDMSVTFHLPGTYIVEADERMTPNVHALFRRWTHWQAEDAFYLSYYPTRADAMALHNSSRKSFAYIISSPGTSQNMVVSPPIIEKQGVVFIALVELVDCINSQEQRATARRAALTWDAQTRAATFSIDGHILHLMLKSPTMRIEGSPDARLPAAPFMSLPAAPLANIGMQDTSATISYLYVPLLPVMQALGGKAQIDAIHREVTLTLP